MTGMVTTFTINMETVLEGWHLLATETRQVLKGLIMSLEGEDQEELERACKALDALATLGDIQREPPTPTPSPKEPFGNTKPAKKQKQWTTEERAAEMAKAFRTVEPWPGRKGGGFEKPSWPYERGVAQSLTSNGKDVFDSLCAAASKDGNSERNLAPGESEPSIPTLAIWARTSRRGVIRAIKDLKARGMITSRQVKTLGKWPHNVYRIALKAPTPGATTGTQ